MVFNLKQQLIFYASYHREPRNIAIHLACVPALLFTGFLFGTNTPSLRTPKFLSSLRLPLNLGTLASLTYTTLYLLLSPNLAGATLVPILLSLSALGNTLTSRYNRARVNGVAVGVHVVSWVMQFIGHGRFEGRRPALMDNLVQALFLAPLFVWYEVLFRLGFYGELRREVEEGVEREVKRRGE
ncbi:DUF962-domain-containing protein [Polyplosphaeria fusca]|uniref:DUF962-domain-containing protein n=1 Tax=Polyplosphaeria fusca TaxID=682080 RepID=A0A9P4QLR2_9PLEO|nr:DUF962-domain-containing protein [Polyplosphaeria fusca]